MGAAPAIDWFDIGKMIVDPYPTFERMRREAPVAWVAAMKANVITRYDDVYFVEQKREVFSANVEGNLMPRVMGRATLLNMDGEEHMRERRLLNAPLRPKHLKEHWTETFKRNTSEFLESLAEKGPDQADLNRDFAAPLAAKNLADLLGFRDENANQLASWSADLIAGLGNVRNDPAIWARVEESRESIDEAIDRVVARVTKQPDASVTSGLVSAGMELDAVKSAIKLSLSGGINEPQHAITGIVWALEENPDQLAMVMANPELWQDVLDEYLRWMSPIGFAPRITLSDVELSGTLLPRGSLVANMFGAANRDERRYENAAKFDVRRPKQSHLAFGSGPHVCVGMWTAKLSVAGVAMPMLYERFDGLRRRSDDSSLWNGFFFRGLTSLPVAWDRDRGSRA
jgi:cytochrome P450